MDDVVAKTKTGRRLARNLIAGLCGLGAALALGLLTLRVGNFLPAWFVAGVVYVLPLPIACGLAVGFVSPQKAIAWAPLWSCILAALVSALLSGAHSLNGASWPVILALTVGGVVVAGLAGLAGQRAAERGYVVKSALALVIACGTIGGAGHMLLQSQQRAFVCGGKPQVLLELDRDYLALPRGMNWSCDRQMSGGSYVLTSRLNGQCIRVFTHARGSALRYIEYELPGGRSDLRSKEEARRYLKALGIRDPFLSGLATTHTCWRSVLRGTQLTIWRNGRILMECVEPARQVD